MKTADVWVAGELFTDLILSGFDSWLEPGRESFAKDFAKEAGGGAAITACGLARLGMKVRVFGVVGACDSEWLLERLRQAGADTTAIELHPSEPTAFTVVASTAQDRGFLTYPGANKALPEALRRAARAGCFSHARHVHLACPPELDTALELLGAIHAGGCTISLDVGWHPQWMDDPRAVSVLQHVDLFFPNEVEGFRITAAEDAEGALACFARMGLARVALKLGSRGAALLWDGHVFHCGPLRVKVVDVTGAGDCFDAGFLYAWLNGHSPQQCLAAGNVCGALSTEARGGITGFPDTERLTEFWP